jgi:hypothetical protein
MRNEPANSSIICILHSPCSNLLESIAQKGLNGALASTKGVTAASPWGGSDSCALDLHKGDLLSSIRKLAGERPRDYALQLIDYALSTTVFVVDVGVVKERPDGSAIQRLPVEVASR